MCIRKFLRMKERGCTGPVYTKLCREIKIRRQVAFIGSDVGF